MSKGSPFCVQTNLGKLQLTKGAFLTLQKRKNSTLRTLAKTKVISKDCLKSTVKRYARAKDLLCSRYDEVSLINKNGDDIRFIVLNESDLLRWKGIKALPTIEMNHDNDEESQWSEIVDCVNNLSLSLSLASFDQRFSA